MKRVTNQAAFEAYCSKLLIAGLTWCAGLMPLYLYRTGGIDRWPAVAMVVAFGLIGAAVHVWARQDKQEAEL